MNVAIPARPHPLKSKNLWTKMLVFQVVQQAWNTKSLHVEPCHILYHCLQHTAKRLKTWSKHLFSQTRLNFNLANEIILRLDVTQEDRPLSPREQSLRDYLKLRIFGLAVLECTRKKKMSRILHLREGDVNTKFFHLRINARQRKNHIHWFKRDHGWVVSHEEKVKVVSNHFS